MENGWEWVLMFIILFDLRLAEGYSASDLTSLAKDAAMGPIRGECWLLSIMRMSIFLVF